MSVLPSPPKPRDNDAVLFVVPDLIGAPGGIARYCRTTLRAIAEEGWPVDVIALHDRVPRGTPPDPARSYVGCAGSRWRFSIRMLLSTVRRRPAVILVGHVNFALLGWICAKLVRRPYVVFIYGTDAWVPLHPLRAWGARWATRIISISNYTARKAVKANNIYESQIRILNNCIDPNLDTASSGVTLDAVPSLLTVSRITTFEPFKGHEYVIRAMPALLARFPELRYDIVGDGDRRAALEELARLTGVREAVHFHGAISDSELAAKYQRATVFIMPSLVEGFGFVFAEAMAYGTPAIGGNRDAAPEVILHGQTGYVVDPESPDEIATAVTAILSEPSLRRRMSLAAREHVRANYSYAAFSRRLMTIVHDVARHS